MQKPPPILFLSVAFVLYFIPKSSVQGGSAHITESAVASQKQEQAISGLPTSLIIPSINIDAPVEYVGLTSDGSNGRAKRAC